MIIKDARLSTKEDYWIKVLDLIRIEDTTVYMVFPVEFCSDKIQLVDMETGEIYDHDTFNHPIHLHNHLLKHYGEYELIKSKHIEMNLVGPLQVIKRGQII